MIARLALTEARIDHDQVFVDIHYRASQQLPDYVRLNPSMTVPTLVVPGRVFDQSRDIVRFALAGIREFDAKTTSWLDRHYACPIEELTFGGLLARSAVARAIIPARLAATQRRLLDLAVAHPDLADAYRRRATVFAERVRTFNPTMAIELAAARRREAIDLLDVLDDNLAAGGSVLVQPEYGAADVVWTVFLARMEFAGMGGEVAARPALTRYWQAMKARPSFAAADVWTKLHLARLIFGIVWG